MKLSYPIDNFLKRVANDKRLLPSHISLFIAIFYHSPGEVPGNFFQVSRRNLMRYSRIRSAVTYHKCIKDLVEYDYILYQRSYDPYRASRIAFIDLR
jgi:hypothetical protein